MEQLAVIHELGVRAAHGLLDEVTDVRLGTREGPTVLYDGEYDTSYVPYNYVQPSCPVSAELALCVGGSVL